MGAAMGTKRRAGGRGDTRAAQLKDAEMAISVAHDKSNADFIKEYLKPSATHWPTWTHPRSKDTYALTLHVAETMSEDDLEGCFDLVHRTSGDDYRGAAVGWHPEAKRAEMRSPGLRYVLVKKASATSTEERDGKEDWDGIWAFTSFMPTFEEGWPVVYCYEIHLVPELAGTGLGSLLMRHVLAAADAIPALEKTMLTCFVANEHARRFYERLGFEVDESSPGTRRLRGGKVFEPDYVIMSKRTRRRLDADGEEQGGDDTEQEAKRTKT